MIDRKGFLELFTDAAAQKDYKKISSGVFRKPTPEFSYQITLSFTGKIDVQCGIRFGFLVPAVENSISKMEEIIQQRAAGSGSLPTIFGTLNTISDYVGGITVEDIYFNKPIQEQINLALNSVCVVESKIKSLADIATLAVEAKGLALGHHAFRVPVLLKKLNKLEDYTKYVEEVKSKDFIADYESFLIRI